MNKNNVMEKSELRKMVEDDYDKLKKMSVEEYTLYKKWRDLNFRFDITDEKTKKTIADIKANIWRPETDDDFQNIEVDVIYVEGSKHPYHQVFEYLRHFTSNGVWRKPIGRCLRMVVIDKVTGKYLGILVLASDLIMVSTREKYIGWKQEHKLKPNMRLNDTAVGSTIIPTQPLGFNFVGGKLMSLLLVSDKVEKIWNERYNSTLAGVTTTSFFGGFSQYSGLKYWKSCGQSSGKLTMEPSDDTYRHIKDWLTVEYPEDRKRINKVSQPRLRLLEFGLKKLGFKSKDKPVNNAPRGVYFCELFKNTKEYLRCETDKLGERKFDNSIESLTELWKTKYASKRFKNLQKNSRLDLDSDLFYDDMLSLTWQETKDKFLGDVGR